MSLWLSTSDNGSLMELCQQKGIAIVLSGIYLEPSQVGLYKNDPMVFVPAQRANAHGEDCPRKRSLELT